MLTNFLIPGRLPQMWLDLLLFKASWVALVVFQTQAVIPALGIVALKIVTWPALPRTLLVFFLVACAGMAMDFMLVLAGVFIFPDAVLPLWLVLLWLSFALTLPRGFAFLAHLPVPVQAVIGMAGGGLGYGAGHALGAVGFGYPIFQALALVAALWALFVPAALYVAGDMGGRRA